VLGSQASATVCELNCPPLPVSAIDTAPALLPIAIDPAAVPAAVGENVTFNAAVWPGVNTVLAPAPVTLNPVPDTSRLESVRLAFPAFIKVTPSEAALPTKTLPKSRLLTLELSSAVAASAVPLAEITSGELGASLTNDTEPAAFPAELGVNITLNVVRWPAAMLVGSAKPDVLKPAPVTIALEIVTALVPPFCKVIVCDPLVPAVTSGKLALIGVAESCG